MSRFLFWLAVIAIAAGALFYFAPRAAGPVQIPGGLPVLPAGRGNGAAASGTSVTDSFALPPAISGLIANPGAAIQADAGAAADFLKNAARDQVANLLNLSTGTAPDLPSPPAADAGAGGVQVCSAEKTSTAVQYKIVPPSPGAAFTYRVDWGDGAVSQGSAAGELTVSHAYSRAGNYNLTFAVHSSGGDLAASRYICVN